MLRRWLPAGGVLTAALAVLLLLPDTSSAQWGRWGRGGIGFNTGRFGFYYGSGGPFNYGFYPSYSSRYYGWNYPYYGSTWSPRYYGSYGGYSPWISRSWYRPSYSYGWYTPSYYSSPSYSSFSYPSSYYSSPSTMTGSYDASDLTSRGYYGASGNMARSDQTVLIHLRVPPEAEVWFDGTQTQSTGMERDYISPPLQPGQDYVYQMRARWMQNGQEVVKTRDLRVRAGDEMAVDFVNEATSGTGSLSGEPVRGADPYTTGRSLQRTPDYSPERTAPGTDRTTPGTDRDLDRTPGPGTTPRSDIPPSGTPGTKNPERP
jgi:uncharacterized protein (TIGR03000 family)